MNSIAAREVKAAKGADSRVAAPEGPAVAHAGLAAVAHAGLAAVAASAAVAAPAAVKAVDRRAPAAAAIRLPVSCRTILMARSRWKCAA